MQIFLRWFFLGLCFPLVFVSQVRGGIATVSFYNAGTNSHFASMVFQSGGWYDVVSSSKSLVPGETWVRSWWSGGGSVSGYRAGWYQDSIGTYSVVDLGANWSNPGDTVSVTLTDAGPLVVPVTTNSWCVYNINWRNPGPLGAGLRGYYLYAGGTIEMVDLHAWVTPGVTFSEKWTNNIGTNTYACPSLILYDERLGDDAPISTVGGTRYSDTVSGGPADGSGSTANNPGPITGPNTNYYAGNTNYNGNPTRSDYYHLTDEQLRALSAIEKAMADQKAASLTGATNSAGVPGSTNTSPSAATNAANSNLPGSHIGSVGDFSFNAATNGLNPRSAPAGLSFAWMGTTVNLDPESWSPGIGSWCRMILSIPLLLWFVYEVSKLFTQLAQTYASAETGGVPDLNASLLGTGGNMAGMVTAALVTTAFLLLWGVLWSWFYGVIMDKIGLANGVGGEIADGNAIAVYLLLLFIPVQLYLTLGTTLAVVRFGASKIIILSSSASRYLWGK